MLAKTFFLSVLTFIQQGIYWILKVLIYWYTKNKFNSHKVELNLFFYSLVIIVDTIVNEFHKDALILFEESRIPFSKLFPIFLVNKS